MLPMNQANFPNVAVRRRVSGVPDRQDLSGSDCELLTVEEWNSAEVPSCRGSSTWKNGYVDNKSGFGEEDDSNTEEVGERELVLVFRGETRHADD